LIALKLIRLIKDVLKTHKGAWAKYKYLAKAGAVSIVGAKDEYLEVMERVFLA